MKVQEFYENLGQDYNEMLDRMIGKEELLLKFVRKYPNDPSFAAFEAAIASDNAEQVFRAAHTLKGVAANLGLKPIVDIITPLVESTRKGNLNGVAEEFEKISKAHYEILALIETIE